MTAAILPNGRKQYFNPTTGAPLGGGSVAFYTPGTTTLKTTWQDQAQTTPNANPVPLDSAGTALIWGSGSYREYVEDSLGNLISDSVTSAYGVSDSMAAVVGASSTSAALALLGGACTIASVALLRAATSTTVPQTQCILTGYTSLADGGEGVFVVGASATDNGGTIINDASGRSWYRLYDKAPLNICWFGAHVNSSSDSAPALNAALAAGGSIYAPAGSYTFNSQIVYTMPSSGASVTITGAGPDITTFAWASANGIKINYISPNNGVHIRDLSLLTGSTTAGDALWLNQTQTTITAPGFGASSDITNVSIRGADGWGVTNCWSVGVLVSGVSNVNFTNCVFNGPGGSAYISAASWGVLLAGTATAN